MPYADPARKSAWNKKRYLEKKRNNVNYILGTSEYFYCEYYKCKLTKQACIKRQNIARSYQDLPQSDKVGVTQVAESHCKECGQGIRIRSQMT
jgi:hypothetical protein